MSLVKWSPAKSIFSLKDEMDRVFNDFLGNESLLVDNMVNLTPLVNIEETDNDYIITAELPGIEKKDIKITFQNNMLNISGEKKEEKEMDNRNFHRVERRYGKFSRSIAIPSSIELDKIDASYKNGILTVKVPKSEEAKPKEIEVKIS
jgi:HSP20 family protein